MGTFGGFRKGDRSLYGEVRGDEVHVLAQPYWLGLNFTGEVHSLGDLQIDVPVAPSKLLAVGLNYADHIAEMKRTPLGTPLIWFKAPTSLLPHNGTIEIAFPEHQTDFETELAVVIGKRAKNVSLENALDYVFGYTIGEDISDRDLQKSEKQFGRAKSFDTYTPVGPFVYTDVDVTDLRIETAAKWRGKTKRSHQSDDLSGGGNRFVCEPGTNAPPGRFDFDRNTIGRRSDSRRRPITGDDWRLAAAAE